MGAETQTNFIFETGEMMYTRDEWDYDFDIRAAECDVEEWGGESDNINWKNERQRDNYLRELELDPERYKRKKANSSSSESSSEGCYIATCVYGSYDCPEVLVLRRFRDNVLRRYAAGRMFVRGYYAISPALVRRFGTCTWFRRYWRGMLDRMIDSIGRAEQDRSANDESGLPRM